MRTCQWIRTGFSTLCYKKNSNQAIKYAGQFPILLPIAGHPYLGRVFALWLRLRPVCAVWLMLLASLVAPPLVAQTTVPELQQLRAERAEDGSLLVSAQVRFELSSAVQDVLTRGIAVYFVAEADLYRNRWYWTDKKLSAAVRQWRLAYQPLTRRWRLTVTSSNGVAAGAALTQNFDSLNEALVAVQRTVRWRVADVNGLSQDADYNLDYRFRLDASQLPRPFQIGALGETDWEISLGRVLAVSLAPPTAREAPKEVPKDASKELAREPAKETPKDASREPVK